LKETLYYIRSNHYDKLSGEYLGVPLKATQFLEYITNKEFVSQYSKDDIYLDIMKSVRRMKVPSLTATKIHQFCSERDKYMDTDNEEQFINFDTVDESEINGSQIQGLGPGSQVSYNFSQQHADITNPGSDDDEVSSDIVDDSETSTPYNTLLPIFTELVSNIKDNEGLKISMDTLQNLCFDMNKRQNKNLVKNLTQTTFLGERNEPKRRDKRHKTSVEQALRGGR
jgi:hypothetical protein